MDKPSDNQTGTEPKYNLRRAIKATTKLDLYGWPKHKITKNLRKAKKQKIKRKVKIAFLFPCTHHDVDPDQDIINHVQAQFDSMSREQFLQMVKHDPELDPVLNEAIEIWDGQLSHLQQSQIHQIQQQLPSPTTCTRTTTNANP